MKVKDLIDELKNFDGDHDIVMVMEPVENDEPENFPDVDDLRVAPRSVSSSLKPSRQFDGEFKEICYLYLTVGDY